MENGLEDKGLGFRILRRHLLKQGVRGMAYEGVTAGPACFL